MSSLSRRSFFGASLAGLAATPQLIAQKPAEPPARAPDDPAFQPSTLFLTWHRDPTTTMTVQWVGTLGETADTQVYYRPVSAGLPAPLAASVGAVSPAGAPPWMVQATTVKPYPLTDFKVFRSELAGLTPGTDYEFRIGKQSPTYRFRTMPAKATDTIHFISGGDCSVNSHTVANNAQAARQDPMFALIGGDLGYDDGKSVAVSLAFLRNYSRQMVGRNGRMIPMVTCIGNHEVDGGYDMPRTKAPFYYALFDGLYPDTGYATLEFGSYLSLVLLDTGHTTPITGEQTDWLEKTLKARRDHPNVLVVNHVPAYPSGQRRPVGTRKAGTGEENRTHWVPLFDKYRVPLVLEHHDHAFKRTRPMIGGSVHDDGVMYLGDGSWGRLRPPQPPEKQDFIATSSEEYHLTLHRIQGEERFHLALDEFGRVMDVGHSGQRKAGLVPASGR